MSEGKPIIFSPEARIKLISITIFIKNEWGTKSVDKFKQQVYKVLNSIVKHPYMYKSTTCKTGVYNKAIIGILSGK